MEKYETTDVLIIGAGIAGLTFALKLAHQHPELRIDIISKGDLKTSNTQLAQGGIAAVMEEDKDSWEKHSRDTLLASHYTADKTISRKITKQAPKAIQELIKWGVTFDKNDNGTFSLSQEGSHSYPRILHCQDQTGAEIVEKLSRQLKAYSNIRALTYHMVLDLITIQNNHTITCAGAYLFDTCSERPKTISATATYLATGGSGQVFAHSTNAATATGDGAALALRAGLALEKMGYYQYHPTVLSAGQGPSTFLISEAIRGAGAKLRNPIGEAFMPRYHTMADLAPRDVVVQAEYEAMKANHTDHLYLDATVIPEVTWKTHFPAIYNQCLSCGINPVTHWIPVAPAAHYQCGGVPIDEQGRTTLPGLYACGECAFSGFHGNNRLASNSLLEGLVMAGWSANHWHFVHSSQKTAKPKDFRWTFQKPSNDWIRTQRAFIKQEMEHFAMENVNTPQLQNAVSSFTRLLKTWYAWQSESYVLDKDFQELGDLLFAGRAILTGKLEHKEKAPEKAVQ